ncbi:hypothetical protein AAE478_010092 [Parahypoxylon ruwenzoriense]
MASRKVYSAFRRTAGELPLTVEHSTETLPAELSPNDVLIKIHAVSLNFRDVAMLHGRYPAEFEKRGIVGSDCAAEVVAIGSAVNEFKVGDRVAPIFDLSSITGYEDAPNTGLGGDYPGVLREYAVFESRYLVHLPKHLSWEEVRPNPIAFGQGTGGVSMMALLICIAVGIKPIITSSSDEKLASIKKISPEVHGINYKSTPDVTAEVLRITNGKGVDIIINNIGPESIPNDMAALRQRAGTISLVGFLGGFTGNWNPGLLLGLMTKRAKLQGVGVGSKVDFQDLNRLIEEKAVSLVPVIDRVFSFEDSREAFDYLYAGKHVGKVIIKLGHESSS